MSNYWLIYWITRLDIVLNFGITMLVAGIIGTVAYTLVINVVESRYSDEDYWTRRKRVVENRKKEFGKYGKIAFILLIIGGTIVMFVPSTKHALFIAVGGKTIDYVQADTSLQKIPYQTTKLLKSYIEKAVEELKENK